jgi:hypothetical protein
MEWRAMAMCEFGYALKLVFLLMSLEKEETESEKRSWL